MSQPVRVTTTLKAWRGAMNDMDTCNREKEELVNAYITRDEDCLEKDSVIQQQRNTIRDLSLDNKWLNERVDWITTENTHFVEKIAVRGRTIRFVIGFGIAATAGALIIK